MSQQNKHKPLGFAKKCETIISAPIDMGMERATRWFGFVANMILGSPKAASEEASRTQR